MAYRPHPARCVALLRGINVGTRNRIAMADLRATFEALGHSSVRTVLASGNVVFASGTRDTAQVARSIRGALGRRNGLDVAVIVKTARQFAAAAAERPIAVDEGEGAKLLVAFAPDRASLRALRPISGLVGPGERFIVGRHAAHLHCGNGIHGSKAAGALLGKAGQATTTRNLATVLKIAALLRGIAE